ncbi:MAG: HD domain-containing protein, partial [Chloroflexi bacterium]|nr:HD domain-containing protein [Chloroflexota bacterium]
CHATAAHSEAVAEAARRLAAQYGVPERAAEEAAWLHDVSAIIPAEKRLDAARALGLEVLPEEAAFPMILHQRLSAVLAGQAFGVEDPAVLSAIACHTTLKRGASTLDQVVFLADKQAWDQPGLPPYGADLARALDESLEAASLVYLSYLWERRETPGVLHPWLREAYEDLRARGQSSLPSA